MPDARCILKKGKWVARVVWMSPVPLPWVPIQLRDERAFPNLEAACVSLFGKKNWVYYAPLTQNPTTLIGIQWMWICQQASVVWGVVVLCDSQNILWWWASTEAPWGVKNSFVNLMPSARSRLLISAIWGRTPLPVSKCSARKSMSNGRPSHQCLKKATRRESQTAYSICFLSPIKGLRRIVNV